MRLLQVHSPVNFIEATAETPYAQIGRPKYGKPVLDREIHVDTALQEATKCALVSMDSTPESKLPVGLPLDMVVYEADRPESERIVHIDVHNPYFQMLRSTSGQKLREVFDSIEDPVWRGDASTAPLMSRCARARTRAHAALDRLARGKSAVNGACHRARAARATAPPPVLFHRPTDIA